MEESGLRMTRRLAGHMAKRMHEIGPSDLRKALGLDGVPFGAVSMDGKATKTTFFDDEYAQVYRPKDALPYGLVRTVTSCLVSSAAMAGLDAHPIPAQTNEMGVSAPGFLRLIEVYPNSFFRVIMYDSSVDSEEIEHYGGWSHLRTVIRVECVIAWQTEGKVATSPACLSMPCNQISGWYCCAAAGAWKTAAITSGTGSSKRISARGPWYHWAMVAESKFRRRATYEDLVSVPSHMMVDGRR